MARWQDDPKQIMARYTNMLENYKKIQDGTIQANLSSFGEFFRTEAVKTANLFCKKTGSYPEGHEIVMKKGAKCKAKL